MMVVVVMMTMMMMTMMMMVVGMSVILVLLVNTIMSMILTTIPTAGQNSDLIDILWDGCWHSQLSEWFRTLQLVK